MYLTDWEKIWIEISIQVRFLFEEVEHSQSLSIQKTKWVKANGEILHSSTEEILKH